MPLPKSITTVTPLSKYLAMMLFVLLPFMGFYLGMQYQKIQEPLPPISSNPTNPPDNETVCTMDAKQCPDGSFVGRVGPDCEFAPCPTSRGKTEGTACDMDAKLCPDGSSVGRIPPDCNFAPCPSSRSEGRFCGGIAGLSCPSGYTCQLEGNYPDAGGTCIPFSTTE